MHRLKYQLSTYKPNRTASNYNESIKNRTQHISTDWNTKNNKDTCSIVFMDMENGRRTWKGRRNLCGWWPLECSRHLKGGEASRWVDAATWESQEPPKIRLGRREENKSLTTLSPIWCNLFTQNFNLSFKVPNTPIYMERAGHCYKGEGVRKVTLLAPSSA